MNTFDSRSALETKELIFLEYNKNKFIDGQIVYVLGDNQKYNII